MSDRDSLGTMGKSSEGEQPAMRYGIAVSLVSIAPDSGLLFSGQPIREDCVAARLRDMSARELVRLLAPFTLMAIVGVLGRVLHPHEKWFSGLLDAFFEACAIAGLLGLTVELFAAHRLIEHVSRDLAGRLVGRHLPRGLQTLVSELANTPFVVHEFTKVYRLRDRGDGYLDVEITISYRVENYSERALDYSPLWAEEEIYEPRPFRLEYATNRTRYESDEGELRALTKQEPGSRVRTIDKLPTVKIEPRRDNLDAPDSCRVLWRFLDKMPREYSEVTAFGRATAGCTLRVDEIPGDLDFFGGGDGFINQGTTWHCDRNFIDGQHVRSWWFRRGGA